MNMIELKIFDKAMQQDIEIFCQKRGYDLAGRHIDMSNIHETYMKNGCFWCLYADALLIGTVAVRNIKVKNTNKKIAELKRMFIMNDYRGKGYGRLMLDTAIVYSRDNGFAKILLDTRIEHDKAIELYREYGFLEIPAYNDNVEAELFFELDL